jgi:hypothetical protein
MPVVQWAVRTGYTVETRDAELGIVEEIVSGPPLSIFLSSEPYMRVVYPGQVDLYIPFVEIIDVNPIRRVVYLKRWLREIDALKWTRDPRNPSAVALPFYWKPRLPPDWHPDKKGHVPPRPRGELGTWQPDRAAPRAEPGKLLRIGDRFKPGSPIPQEGQYMCTVCWARKHTRQFREENPDGMFPPAHHPGALWELEDLRP